MASILDRFTNLLKKNTQQTAADYNKSIYNWLGNSIVWSTENDNSYITEGYQKNLSLIHI